MGVAEIGGALESKAAKRRARKARAMAKLVADGKDLSSRVGQRVGFSQSTNDYKRLYNKVRRGTPFLTNLPDPFPRPHPLPHPRRR